MTEYAWPAYGQAPAEAMFRVGSLSQLSTSPYTGASIGYSLGQLWMATLTFNNRLLEDAFDFQAFLSRLEGPINPVRLFDWQRRFPRLFSAQAEQPFSDLSLFDDGSGWAETGLTPLVSATALLGARTILTDGWPVSTSVLMRGDLFGVGGFMYEVLKPAATDSSGATSITFQPGLREQVIDGDPLRLYRPNCRFRLMTDAEAAINRNVVHGEPFTLSFMEYMP